MSKLRAATCLALLTLTFSHWAAARQADARAPYRLSLPGETWALDIDLSDFNVPARAGTPGAAKQKGFFFWTPALTEEVSGDGSQYRLLAFRRAKEKSGSSVSTLSISLSPALAPGTAADFRDLSLKALAKSVGLKGDNAKTSEYNGVPLARYTVKYELDAGNFYSGPIPVTNYGPRSLVAYFVNDGVWVALKLTARDLGEDEEKLFYALLDSVKFVDTSAPSNSFDYYHLGRAYYLARDYDKAAVPLTMAVALEHRERRLDIASWRDLVAKLIDSLAATAQLKKSKELMDYAAARDPTYPLFELALARFYAGDGDLDQTIAHLEKAFLHRENVLYRPLPDPLYDPAFERFRKDERFKKAVKALKK